MQVKAIQTVYKSYKFRSRLEARWAVFFDALELDWTYEAEGYVLPDGSYYLPDFEILSAGRKYLVEIKSGVPSADEFHKGKLLAHGLNIPIFFLSKLPDPRGGRWKGDTWPTIDDAYLFIPATYDENYLYGLFGYYKQNLPDFLRANGFPDTDNVNCFRDDAIYYLNKYGTPHKQHCALGRLDEILEVGTLTFIRENDNLMESASNAARSARFEYGESGASL